MIMPTVAVLYARKNSIYNQFSECDVYDELRDARSYSGILPVIAHPPCRLWGRLRGLSNAPLSERLLAFHALETVRKHGGILEHPCGSKLWVSAGLPFPGQDSFDTFGGFTFQILQSWFGHKAPKSTWLYIVGISPSALPAFPFQLGIPTGRICTTGSRKMREGTPVDLAKWLISVAQRCKPVSVKSSPCVGINSLSQVPRIDSYATSARQLDFFSSVPRPLSRRQASERASCAPPQAAFPPATNRGGKVVTIGSEDLNYFCDF